MLPLRSEYTCATAKRVAFRLYQFKNYCISAHNTNVIPSAAAHQASSLLKQSRLPDACSVSQGMLARGEVEEPCASSATNARWLDSGATTPTMAKTAIVGDPACAPPLAMTTS